MSKSVMLVSSIDYGVQYLLERITEVLTIYGFDIFKCGKEIIPDCEPDYILGIIKISYGIGQGELIPRSITHEEIVSIIRSNKRRWLLVHDNVVFAQCLLSDLGFDSPEKRKDKLPLKVGANSITSLQVIDVYEEAMKNKDFSALVHTYHTNADARLFASAQFYHVQESQVKHYISFDRDNSISDVKITGTEAKAKEKPVVMVSSPVYGYEDLLERLFDLLSDYGYDVWMSHKGTLPVDSNDDITDNCLNAVNKCHLFLGIITPVYGTVEKNKNFSMSHMEIQQAIQKNKLRCFLTHDSVAFAKRLLDDLGYNIPEKRQQLTLKENASSVTDLRVIDMYEEVEIDKLQQKNTEINASVFYEKFYRFQEAELYITENLANPDKIIEKYEYLQGVIK